MASKVRRNPRTPPHSIFHRGLIKLLIVNHLNKISESWDHFLSSGDFVSDATKIKSKKKGIPTDNGVSKENPQPTISSNSVETRSMRKCSAEELNETPKSKPHVEKTYTRKKKKVQFQEEGYNQMLDFPHSSIPSKDEVKSS
jgi:hypothetical protein